MATKVQSVEQNIVDLSGNGYSYFMVFLKEAFKEDEAYNLADTLEIIWNL